MTPETNSTDKIVDIMTSRFDSIDEDLRVMAKKLDHAYAETARHDVQLNNHGQALRWMFGIMAGLVVATLVHILAAQAVL